MICSSILTTSWMLVTFFNNSPFPFQQITLNSVHESSFASSLDLVTLIKKKFSLE
ncbi:unnamed protein product [Brassica napus]|uniref:(rape) hypothetical protein n=1 Tax=Brassica napus TaxID=3708 RepID=A0A816SJF2_BRANA|nr:unnamed protein product [Brassica napus]